MTRMARSVTRVPLPSSSTASLKYGWSGLVNLLLIHYQYHWTFRILFFITIFFCKRKRRFRCLKWLNRTKARFLLLERVEELVKALYFAIDYNSWCYICVFLLVVMCPRAIVGWLRFWIFVELVIWGCIVQIINMLNPSVFLDETVSIMMNFVIWILENSVMYGLCWIQEVEFHVNIWNFMTSSLGK